MTFVDTLMRYLSGAFDVLASGIQKLLEFLSYPLGWLVALIEGIWYFLTSLVQVVILVIDIFIALFQFIGALFLGFFRTIKGLLWIDMSKTPVNYPGASGDGIDVVKDMVLGPIGFLDVVPYGLLAIVWLLFIVRVFSLLGGTHAESD
ncbi:hypothetical protein [Paenibacillus thiaminolyticus]|uniref:Uncharacterized protein n=1 Tax=Paenibacillus thiaminolyticus TaxID=49283 RepID=A0A3A3GH18_PANTH|nr:hypothetical protein [Paenibacillus thiaminolyticus]RJG23299.1 hypothetical protein DQX05_13705 [Paenibacillus thiaminolyticus]RJG23316.1 hypothetical protein DQX05_13795 [Paenibacillus thiaminolyticus]